MQYTFVTLFANIIRGYFEDSILARAIRRGLIDIDYINPRDFSNNKHKKVDDTAFGGGAGMLMSPQPLYDALESIRRSDKDAHIVFLQPAGKEFVQNDAKRLASKDHIVFVSGRYEGIDERVLEEFADEVFSIGEYVLTGGELPSLVVCDAISRHIDGVLGNAESLAEESFEMHLLEGPSFTKPQKYKEKSVPSEFLKGNHSKIRSLKIALAKCKTSFFRPAQYKAYKAEDRFV